MKKEGEGVDGRGESQEGQLRDPIVDGGRGNSMITNGRTGEDADRRDWLVASEVGDWYVGSPSMHGEARVAGAYGRLQTEIDGLFVSLFCSGNPNGPRCAFTYCRQPYGSDRDLIASVRADGVLEMTTSAASSGRLHPLLGCEFGGAFDRFRAVHDFIGHVKPAFGFDLDGEIAAWRIQRRLHSAPAQWALATELYGVNCARSLIGEAPELKAQLLDLNVYPQSDGSVSAGPMITNSPTR
ncbi:MAG: hypothetical protein ABSF33_04155 [Acidimicrobiales bacterium]|jgi:hypothetical protein